MFRDFWDSRAPDQSDWGSRKYEPRLPYDPETGSGVSLSDKKRCFSVEFVDLPSMVPCSAYVDDDFWTNK